MKNAQINQLENMSKITYIIHEVFLAGLGEGGKRASKTTSFSRLIKPKAMKNNKGREGGGGHKIGNMGRRRLWMTLYCPDCSNGPKLQIHSRNLVIETISLC